MPTPDPELHFLWLEVMNLQNAVNFYRETLGFPVQDDAGSFAVVHLANTKLYLAPGFPRGLGMHIAIAIPDVDKMAERLRRHGLAIAAISDEGWARYISITDPEGYRLLLVELTPSEEEQPT